jgi:acetyl esterase/lipase
MTRKNRSMRRRITMYGLIGGLLCCAAVLPAAEPTGQPIALWPDGVPVTGKLPNNEKTQERSKDPAKPNRAIRSVTHPTLTIYLPDKPPTHGAAAVVICPGGGYGGLAIDKEGHDVARWLTQQGVAGIVLKYRMPRVDLTGKDTPLPLADAQRAIQTVRAQAAAWKIDPKKVGIIGFSAGGHLAATAATHGQPPQPSAKDTVQQQSSRPDFAILVYPVVSMVATVTHRGSRRNLLGPKPDDATIQLYSNEQQVNKTTPPTFLVHTEDDGVKIRNSELFFAACKTFGVPAEFVRFKRGGHGYGLGIHGGPVATWPARCVAWMKTQKILPSN